MPAGPLVPTPVCPLEVGLEEGLPPAAVRFCMRPWPDNGRASLEGLPARTTYVYLLLLTLNTCQIGCTCDLRLQGGMTQFVSGGRQSLFAVAAYKELNLAGKSFWQNLW